MKDITLDEVTFSEFLTLQRTQDPLKDLEEVSEDVRKIIKNVKKNGDDALLKYTEIFDKLKISNLKELIFNKKHMEKAFNSIDDETKNNLSYLKERIKKFHESIPQQDWEREDEIFEKFGQISRPIKRVGLYAPGGNAIYPSSVLMTSVLAKMSGVKEIMLSFPPSRKEL